MEHSSLRWMTFKTSGHLFYTTLSFVHHYKAICKFKPNSTNNSGQNRRFFVPCNIEIWWITLKNNRTPLPCCFKLCASFHCHLWFHSGATVRKCSMPVKIGDFLSCVTLKFDGWPWKQWGPFSVCFKFCASFQSHGWNQTGATVQKLSIWVKIEDFLAVWP